MCMCIKNDTCDFSYLFVFNFDIIMRTRRLCLPLEFRVGYIACILYDEEATLLTSLLNFTGTS